MGDAARGERVAQQAFADHVGQEGVAAPVRPGIHRHVVHDLSNTLQGLRGWAEILHTVLNRADFGRLLDAYFGIVRAALQQPSRRLDAFPMLQL